MSDKRYLMHVTIETGHATRCYRDEMDDALVTLTRQQLEEMLAGLPVEVRPGYRLTGAAVAGQAILATVSKGDMPLATIAVAGKAKASRTLWDLLRKPPMRGMSPAVGDPPRAPWVAVQVFPMLLMEPDAAQWLGLFERALAWAWIGVGFS